MHELLERLGRGDIAIIGMCAGANQAWTAFFAELEGADVGTLAARLGFFQPVIIRLFDDARLGESMVAWTAFANLYDTHAKWGPNARRALELHAAFAASHCSALVKAEARSAAISYEIDKLPGAPKSR